MSGRTGAVGVGLIGAGMISDQYLTNLAQYPDLEVVAIGDIATDAAAARAEKYGVVVSGGPDVVLNHPDVEIVINLTIPAVHVEVSTQAIEAGKHVWSEKPIGIERESAARLVELADARGLLLGIAPDTVLGRRWQTAKRALQSGAIGRPLNAVTSFQSQGPAFFHPNAAFLYAKGAGPLFDMGPYYPSALVHLLGPIANVIAVGSKAHETGTVKAGPQAGTVFPVEVPTHLSVVTTFEAGQTASSLMSTDTPLWRHGIFEINGTEGTMVIGDPNFFSGTGIRIYRPFDSMPEDYDLTQTPEDLAEVGPEYGRGAGALTMARTIRGGDLHIATGHVGYHVLDAMCAIEESAERREFVEVTSTVAPIPALPADFDPFAATL